MHFTKNIILEWNFEACTFQGLNDLMIHVVAISRTLQGMTHCLLHNMFIVAYYLFRT